MSTLHEIVAYMVRKLVAFERMLSPPKPKVRSVDAVDYGKEAQVVHVHHYYHEATEKPLGYWEKVYRNLLKGF